MISFLLSWWLLLGAAQVTAQMMEPPPMKQSLEDSSGQAPSMPPGTRVKFLPDKDPTKLGTIEHQILHYDQGEFFFGNVVVVMDDGRRLRANCWQCEKVPA